jgi:hypothetical protein
MVTVMGAALVENEWIILIEVRTTTNSDFLLGEGPSRTGDDRLGRAALAEGDPGK